MKLRKIVVSMLFLALCVAAGKYIVKPRSGDRKGLPFSEGVLVGNTLYIAGHIGLDAKTNMPPANPGEEARLVMDGIKQTVESAGLSMDDISFYPGVLHGFEAVRYVQRCLQNLLPRRLSGESISGGCKLAAWRQI